MGEYIKALVLTNYSSVAGYPHRSMSAVVSFVTFSLVKDNLPGVGMNGQRLARRVKARMVYI